MENQSTGSNRSKHISNKGSTGFSQICSDLSLVQDFMLLINFSILYPSNDAYNLFSSISNTI